jgi:branched-chain amino acid transport system ATP-binding protein
LALLEVQDLGRKFGGVVALKDVSFSVDQGEIVGLIGANGAGKSTIFNVISGMLSPSSGKVLFEGRDITGSSPHKVAKMGISRTFQSARPFPGLTVEENVRVGAEFGRTKWEDVEAKVEEALELTGLDSKRKLSVGSVPIEQRKLVEVARALASSPKILMMDEPMAGLNQVEVSSFVELAKKINKRGVTVLVVEHVMKAIVTLCSRIIVLHVGQKLAEGRPEDILADTDVVRVYLGSDYAAT